MKIAIEGCAHGELETIYDSIELLETEENVKIDLLICCGDFQSTRNLQDLYCMAVPPKYYDICTFYKYYSGEKLAPYLTIFIGGNHEASNYLQELPYGGWVAPNIYYLGYAGVVSVAGIRLGGISGIFKGFDYPRGHFELAPYNNDDKRSVYHIRNVEVFRLKQISQPMDIFLSHDWPKGICKNGDVEELLNVKPFLRDDIESGRLGSAPCGELLKQLKPDYWFAAHLHCKFAAVVPHLSEIDTVTKVTKFLALDKCLPERKFLQIVDIPHDPDSKIEIKYDLEWLSILHLTNHLVNVNKGIQYLPGPGGDQRWAFTPTREEKDYILEKFGYELVVPENFISSVPPYSPDDNELDIIEQASWQSNEQTELFCQKLGVDDPTFLAFQLYGGSSLNDDSLKDIDCTETVDSPQSYSSPDSEDSPDLVEFKANLSLPMPKQNGENSLKSKLNLTVPSSVNNSCDLNDTSSDTTTTTILTDEFDETSDSSLNTSSFFENAVENTLPLTKKFKRRNESPCTVCVEI